MALHRARYLLIFLFTTLVGAEDSDIAVSNSILVRAMREMTNQTNADSLNLPANASSIRENITDTFSCENRTYGYYADVDNDCQVFHVCLPSQTPSGRNVTYRWSFICPKETVFNQEVLTCTRPHDSIPCKDSPMFYHLNMEIGKIANKTEDAKGNKDDKNTQKTKSERKNEKIVMESFVKEYYVPKVTPDETKPTEVNEKTEASPILIEAVIENGDSEFEDLEQEQKREEELDKIVMERNMRHERQMRRGALRFRNDV